MLNNISRRQFAEKVSVNESYLSRILNRKDPITGSFLLNIKKYYQDIDISFDIDVKIPETKTVKKFTENVTPRNFNFRHVPVVSKYAYASLDMLPFPPQESTFLFWGWIYWIDFHCL